MTAPHLFPPDRADLIRSGRREGIRFVLEQAAWASLAADAPARAGQVPLLGLWGDASGHVHALFHDGRARPLIATVAVEAGRYHALSARSPAAIPYERMVRDLWGFEAMHAGDLRALLDHGLWGATAPMAARPGPAPRAAEPPEWRPAGADDDEGLVYLEEGPVGLPSASGFRARMIAAGDRLVTVELQRGYGHRGVAALAAGLTPDAATRIAARISAAVVANGLAFARAIEAASGTAVPARAAALREVAAETERAAAFLGSIVLCARAGGAHRLAAEAAILLERMRTASVAGLGHRFGAELVVPGGVARDLPDPALTALGMAADMIGRELRGLAGLYEARLAARLSGLGVVTPAAASLLVASGVVGRASGQGFDARRANALVPVEAPCGESGCTDARMRLRLAGVGQAASRLRRLIETLPEGPVRVGLGASTGEGLGLVEAPEGDLWHFVRLDPEGAVAAFFPRDPSVAHMTLFEAACRGAQVEDVGVIAASFGLSSEAVDL